MYIVHGVVNNNDGGDYEQGHLFMKAKRVEVVGVYLDLVRKTG